MSVAAYNSLIMMASEWLQCSWLPMLILAGKEFNASLTALVGVFTGSTNFK